MEKPAAVVADPSVNSSTSMVETLPVDILTRILEFSFVPDCLNLARCNTSLLKKVTKDCTSLWVDICFYYDIAQEDKRNRVMNDEMLAALLTRVDAINVTKSLNLEVCHAIKGHGLEPLRGSRIVERVNLRTGNYEDDGIDEAVSMEILQSSLSFNLFQVKLVELRRIISIVPPGHERYAIREEGHRMMRDQEHKLAIKQNIVCKSCPSPVRTESRQIVPNNHGYQATRCSECGNHYCRTGSCPTEVKDCEICKEAYCSPCGMVRNCSDCHISACGDCLYISPPCFHCNESFCEPFYCSSEKINNSLTCDMCNKTVCELCVEKGPAISFCSDCCDYFCQECRDVKACRKCEMEDPFCSHCMTFNHCIKCDTDICSFHAGQCCRSCKKGICYQCETGRERFLSCSCIVCNGSMCSECSSNTCDTCRRPLCSTCESGGACPACAKTRSQQCERPTKRAKLSS